MLPAAITVTSRELFKPMAVVVGQALNFDRVRYFSCADLEVHAEVPQIRARKGAGFVGLPHRCVQPFELTHQ